MSSLWIIVEKSGPIGKGIVRSSSGWGAGVRSFRKMRPEDTQLRLLKRGQSSFDTDVLTESKRMLTWCSEYLGPSFEDNRAMIKFPIISFFPKRLGAFVSLHRYAASAIRSANCRIGAKHDMIEIKSVLVNVKE